MTHDLIARLAASNPVPMDAPVPAPESSRAHPHRAVLVLALAAAVAVPAVALAGRLGDLLGLSNPGVPVATNTLALAQDTKLSEAMQELDFPSTMQLLGMRNGIGFYAARRADGIYCFALEVDGTRGGVSCDLQGRFPSPDDPVYAFPPYDNFAGFAADGVATVRGLDASGQVLASVPVHDNLFAAAPGSYESVTTLDALDDKGQVVWTWHLPAR